MSRNVSISLPCQIAQTIAAAALVSASVVVTWKQTRSAPNVLAVTAVLLLLLKAAYMKYRTYHYRKYARKYTLPYIRYNDGGDMGGFTDL